jgi:hypothetical protein
MRRCSTWMLSSGQHSVNGVTWGSREEVWRGMLARLGCTDGLKPAAGLQRCCLLCAGRGACVVLRVVLMAGRLWCCGDMEAAEGERWPQVVLWKGLRVAGKEGVMWRGAVGHERRRLLTSIMLGSPRMHSASSPCPHRRRSVCMVKAVVAGMFFDQAFAIIVPSHVVCVWLSCSDMHANAES